MPGLMMRLPNSEIELPGSNGSWKQRARRTTAKAVLRLSVAGAKWIERLALWIDPTLETDAEIEP